MYASPSAQAPAPAMYPQTFAAPPVESYAPDSAPLLAAAPPPLPPRVSFPTFTFPRNNLLNAIRMSAILNVLSLMANAAIVIVLVIALVKISGLHCGGGGCSSGTAAAAPSSSSSSSSSGTLPPSTAAATATSTVPSGRPSMAKLSCEGSALCEYTMATFNNEYVCDTFGLDGDSSSSGNSDKTHDSRSSNNNNNNNNNNNDKTGANVLLTADVIVLLGDSFVSGAGSTSYSATSWVGRLMTRIRSANGDRDLKVFNGAIGQAGAQQDLAAQVAALLGSANNSEFARTIWQNAHKQVVVLVSTNGLTPSALQQQLVTAVYGRLLGSRPRDTVRVFFLVSPDPYWGIATKALSADLQEATSQCVPSSSLSTAATSENEDDKQMRNAIRSVYYQVAMRYSATVINVDMALGRFAFGGPAVMRVFETAQQQQQHAALAWASAIQDTSALSTTCSAASINATNGTTLKTAVLSDRGHMALANVVWQCAAGMPYIVPASLVE